MTRTFGTIKLLLITIIDHWPQMATAGLSRTYATLAPRQNSSNSSSNNNHVRPLPSPPPVFSSSSSSSKSDSKLGMRWSHLVLLQRRGGFDSVASSVNKRAALLAVVIAACAGVFIWQTAMVARGYGRGDVATKVRRKYCWTCFSGLFPYVSLQNYLSRAR